MPSGVSHMLLSRESLEYLQDIKCGKIKDILNLERGAFIMGSVGPDLPYVPAPIPKSDLADSFHTHNTNKIPLFGLSKAKSLFKDGDVPSSKAVFALFLGYASHLSADGCIHPFVRDMVGDYELAKVAHRTLEVKLDVLLADYYFEGNCSSIDVHDELDFLKNSASEELLYSIYADAVNQCFYGNNIESSEVKRWVKGMSLMFEVTSGNFPVWYKNVMGEKGLAHKDIQDILKEKKSLVTLTKPKPHNGLELPHNFLNKETVNLLEDVIPIYFKVFPKIAESAYEYVFEDGPLPDTTILEINLDTGRLLISNNFNEGPAYGSMV